MSTEKQTTENQRFEIERFSECRNITVAKWINETISSSKKMEERLLGNLLIKLKKGDVLIVSEISRIGRNLMQIMNILSLCMERKVSLFAVKEGYELGDNINSKVLAFAFGLSAEIERNLISQRTKESLARLKSQGKKLGRPIGSKSKLTKLSGHYDFIVGELAKNKSYQEIANTLKVHRHTLNRWLKNQNIYYR